MTAERQALGRAGEDAALRWYLARGCTLVSRNWRCRYGEIDLVVADGDTIVFCEVKTRSSSAWGGGLAAVGVDKQRRCRALATRFLVEQPWRGANVRFDVAGVLRERGGLHVEVIADAF